tara:strand:- start:11783 stop:12514 length:732 start_codon:yes stop_codon:yes gene_type:complete
MWSIAKRELRFYFSNITGYLFILFYFTINTLLLWFLDTPFLLFSTGLADLSPFFEISPWLFVFLIPAISMRSFSEERSTGTLELLLTKPINPFEIYLGKFLGIAIVLIITILPTTINILGLVTLLQPNSNLDLGNIFASYLALILLSILFLNISLCISILFKNQITSFLVAFLICFIQYFFWNFIANVSSLPSTYILISNLGIQAHYLNLIHGLLKLEDMIYFLGLDIAIFILGIELIKKEQA